MSTNFRELLFTPERRAKAEAWQKTLRERLGANLPKHQAEITYVLGVSRERMCVRQILALEQEPEAGSVQGHERMMFLMNQLAEGLAMQARFREAAELTRSQPHREEYLRKAEALEARGQDCRCPIEMTMPSAFDAKGVTLPARIKCEVIFDGEFLVTLSHCQFCGGLLAATQ